MAQSCHYCHDPDPIVFSFASEAKVSLCSHDIPRFYADFCPDPPFCFPVLASPFIDKPEDYPLFTKRSRTVSNANKRLDVVGESESQQWQEAVLRVKAMHEDVKDEVDRGFERVYAKLEKLHESLDKTLKTIKEEFEKHRWCKEHELSATAGRFFTALSEGKVTEMLFYHDAIHSATNAIRRDIDSIFALKPDKVEEWLAKIIQIPGDESDRSSTHTVTMEEMKNEDTDARGA